MAQKIAEGDEKGERDDPRDSEPNTEKQEGPDIATDSPMETALQNSQPGATLARPA